MKKSLKSMLSVVLVLVMTFALCAPAFAAESSAPDYTGKNYVALGDSITAGRGVEGYCRGIPYFLEGSFAWIVKNAIGAADAPYDISWDLTDGAVIVAPTETSETGSFAGGRGGMRSHELRVILDDNYEGDDFTRDYFSVSWANPMDIPYLKACKASYSAAIARADLITISLGSNELLGTAKYYLECLMEEDAKGTALEGIINDAIEAARSKGLCVDALASLIETAEAVGMYTRIVGSLVSKVLAAIEDFKDNWDYIMNYIYTVNEDVDVVALGLYNPAGSFVNEAVAKLLDPLFGTINYYIRFGSPFSTRYSYADLTPVGPYIGAGHSAEDGVHPDADSYKMIADIVLETLGTVHCTHEHVTRHYAKLPFFLKPGYTGDLVCDDCGELIEQGSVMTLFGNIEIPKGIGYSIVDTFFGSIFGSFGSILIKILNNISSVMF